MPTSVPNVTLPGRSPAWKWWVCGLLLLATMLNYMDRLTLNLSARRIMDEFGLTPVDYGQRESAFAFAFALGAIVFGWLADRFSVRWLYAAAVLAWSAAGFATGLATGFLHLLLCRALLGLFEAGNWPCALRTTQHILPPSQRTMGNSILQSGAAVGAVLTPLLVIGLGAWTGTWRWSFMAVGLLGVTWVVLWLPVVGPRDLDTTRTASGPTLVSILAWLVLLLAVDTAVRVGAFPGAPDWAPLLVKGAVTVLGIGGVFLWLREATRDDRELPRRTFLLRFWAMVVLVVAINTTWHFYRAWLPLFLGRQHGYADEEVGWFSMAYYVATDLGSLASGVAVLLLLRLGLSVHWSRVTVFVGCAALTGLGLVVAVLPAGWPLLAVLLVIGFASLAMFPLYYSFSQDLTVRHQGKVTGALGCINWLAMSLLHELVGASVQATQSYSQGLALAGVAPMVGFAALLLLWRKVPVPALVVEAPLGGAPPAPDESIRVGEPTAPPPASSEAIRRPS
ncbi:MAG: MFS transporter [Gemmataceae bacterium]|nr:MFS transporter [Gemmataceae bacterium]